ncbi:MAG: hypothetical protein K2N51_15620 [Lachnospiraceae bacterium]|nr:hypothetical protein [Lachnospiraceae bacterium]
MSNTNKGVSDLANVLTGRIHKQTEQPPNLDFGTIKKNGTLQTNTFPANLQRGDYCILEHCKSDIKDGTSARVLVAWVEDDAVVVGVLAGEEVVPDG